MSAARFRITNVLLALVLLTLLAIVMMLATGVRGGPLDPTGTPGSTPGVRLPGTPISGPTTITQPGYYYLTNDITVTGSQNAITISSDDVALDLGGFHIRGGGGQNSVGIGVTGLGQPHVKIRNGTVSNFYVGIDVTVAGIGAHVTDILVRNTKARAIAIGSYALVEDCMVHDNDGEGVVAEGHGSTIRNCDINRTDLNGVFLIGNSNIVENSSFHSNGITSDTAQIRVLGADTVVRGNAFSADVGNEMYITGTNTLVANNTGRCPLGVKDSTASTDYYNNPCIEVAP